MSRTGAPMRRIVHAWRRNGWRLLGPVLLHNVARGLRRLRPQFPRPESLTMIPWGRRVASLVECGLWTHLVARIDDPAVAEACMARLRALELAEFRDAIVGRSYQALWSRADSKYRVDEQP